MSTHDYSVAVITALESKNSSTIAKKIGVSQSTTSRFLQKTGMEEIDLKPLISRIFKYDLYLFISASASGNNCIISLSFTSCIHKSSFTFD